MNGDLLTENQAAEYITIPVRTLQRWRMTREHLPFVKLGKSVRYQKHDLDNFIKLSIVDSNLSDKPLRGDQIIGVGH